MQNALPVTTSILLDLLRDESRPEGWQDFTSRYWPVLSGFALKLGLSEADASDAAQQALADFLREFRAGRYVRERGRLSSFILGIARNRVLRLRSEARRRSRRIVDQGGDFDDTPDDQTLSMVWESERRRVILEQALEELRTSDRLDARTLSAFELVALRDVSVEEAAAQSGLSVDAVYLARHRCTKRLREIAERLTAAWDEDA